VKKQFKYLRKSLLLTALSLRARLIVFFSIMIIIPLFILSASVYSDAQDTIVQNAKREISDKINASIKGVDIYIENADSILQLIFFDSLLRDYILNSEKSDFELSIAANKTEKIIRGYAQPYGYIDSIYIAGISKRIFSSDALVPDKLLKEKWFIDFYKNSNKFKITNVHDASIYSSSFFEEDALVFSILRNYVDVNTNNKLGVMGIDIKYSYIADLFEKEKAYIDSLITVVMNNGEIIYHPDTSSVGMTIDRVEYAAVFQSKSGSYIKNIDNRDYLIVFTTSPMTDWKIIQMTPMDEINLDGKITLKKVLVISTICFIVGVILSILISYGITAPVQRLSRAMEKVENENFEMQVPVVDQDEIGQLTAKFNEMNQRIGGLINRIYKEEQEKKHIELKLLQEQINPHFLFNTLDSINWMARIQNSGNISETITALIKLLQSSTYVDKEFLTIEEEIENLKNYVHIQKFRYGDKFDVEYRIDDDVKKCYILKSVLQPIVENSINHGFKDIINGGRIIVNIETLGQQVIIQLNDNGAGMTICDVEKVLDEDEKHQNNYSSIGLSNTNKRIQLYYGYEYGIQIESQGLGKGTNVVLNIPYETEERGVE